MKRKFLLPLVALPLVLGAFAIKDRATFDRKEWLEDFSVLKSGIEQSYANLKWARSAKQADLVELNRTTIAALEAAHNTKDGRKAIAGFLAGFKDGHLHLESGPPKPVAKLMSLWSKDEAAPVLSFSASAAEACKTLGYSDNGFESDVVNTSGHSYGRIRIELFSQYKYGSGCKGAWNQFRVGKSGSCDEKCQEEFAHAAKIEIAGELARAGTRAANGRDGLVIDLTGNGGGTEWAEYAAAALSPKPLVTPRVAGIRTEHWKKELGDSVLVSCDLKALWTDKTFQPKCWNVALLPADTSAPLTFAEAYRGKLWIVVDGATASASEYFAGVLQDNGVATIVGSKTLGAGCGYTNGGVTITLPHSGLVVKTPDCVRLRRDGSNEYSGILPAVRKL